MQPRRSLISRLRSLFRRVRPERPQPMRPVRKPREAKPRGIEPLEGRIAPASVLPGGFGISYTDLDGDLVTVSFSKALLASTSTDLLSQIFQFSDGASSVAFDSNEPQLLQMIDLTKTPLLNTVNFLRAADGTSLTITAVKGEGGIGDDLASIGAIKASSVSLNKVEVDGDLGQIDAGRAGGGVKSLVVNSLYKLGEATQIAGGTSADKLESRISGVLGSLEVKTDLYGYVRVQDASDPFTGAFTAAKIGSIKVGGSLIGKAAKESASNNTGTIESQGSIGTVQILGVNDPSNPSDKAGLVGGGGTNSGSIVAGAGIASINIADSLSGGEGTNSGSVVATGAIGKINVGQSLVGGAGIGSGSIFANKNIGTATVGQGLVGGAGVNSGSIVAKTTISELTIDHDIIGGAGNTSGTVQAVTLTKATIGGDVTGGVGEGSGAVTVSKTINRLTISGDVEGGAGKKSGTISAGGSIAQVSIDGDVVGGNGFHSGSVYSGRGIGKITVGDEITGGVGERSGSIGTDGSISLLSVGKLVGGNGANSGSVFAGIDPKLHGIIAVAAVEDGITGGGGLASGSIFASKLGSIRVGSVANAGGLHGGTGDFSGSIVSNSSTAAVKIHGSVEGGAGDHSGTIDSHGRLAKVTITGDLKGGGGDYSGALRALETVREDFTGTAASIGTVIIGGNIAGGSGVGSGRVDANGNLVSLSAASLTGGSGDESGAIVVGSGFLGAGNAGTITITGAVSSAEGSVDPSIVVRGTVGKLSVGSLNGAEIKIGNSIVTAIVKGSMVNSLITSGGATSALPMLSKIAIGSLTVKGDVTGSQILAGYGLDGSALNADVSIGAVSVTGNWTASDLVAGVVDVNQDGFGNADDVAIDSGGNANILSRIASILIHGTVTGTSTSGDSFGFSAQKIGSMKVGSSNLGFDAKAGNQSIQLADDVFAREVPV